MRLPVAPLPPSSQAASLQPESTPPAPEEQTLNEEEGIQPYENVITPDAETQTGLFKVHRIGNQFYFEIPPSALNVDMLWYAETAAVPPRLAAGRKLGSRLVRWARQNDTVRVLDLTHALSIRSSADGLPVAPDQADGQNLGVAQVTQPSIIVSFPIAAEGADGALVIDVTSVLARNIEEFSARTVLQQAQYEVSFERDFEVENNLIQNVTVFSDNLSLLANINFRLTPPQENYNNYAATELAVGMQVRHSILLLPKQPMRPRFADPRVGFFDEKYTDYSYAQDVRVPIRGLINRYHLEKREPDQAVSEVVKPIVFYISRNVPSQWRAAIKRGVEAWQPVFEAAGFRNAIVAKDAPSADEAPEWDVFDTRHSVIHWQFTGGEYAEANWVADPRSGEILFSRIYFTADMLQSEAYAYFAQVSALNARAQTLPLSNDVLGKLLESTISHEVGHALGLAHNFKASQAYSVAQLRDPEFVSANGIAASIMSYAAYNYVAQPEDGLTPEQLVPRIGPYDTFAIRWGYAPISQTQTPADEAKTLDAWASEQTTNPWLAYDGDYDGDHDGYLDDNDPTVLRFNLSSQRLLAAQLGMKNLERSLSLLSSAPIRTTEDSQQLIAAHEMILYLRANFLQAAATVPGGVIEQRTLGEATQPQFVPVPTKTQREAVQFVLDNLQVPKAFLRPDVAARYTSLGVMEPLMDSQKSILYQLIRPETFVAFVDIEARGTDEPYALVDYLSDIQQGVWGELDATEITVHPMRRGLHRFYLELVDSYLSEDSYTDFRASARTNLRTLLAKINTVLPNTTDAMAKAHLEDVRDEIERILGITK